MADSTRREQLLLSLRDENEGLRNHSATGLGQVGESAIPKLIELFEDDDLVIREAAVSAVVQVGEPAIAPLIEALEEDGWAIREQAASALGKLKTPEAVDPLVKALKDKDGGVRTAAVWALERIGDARAVPGLVECLMDKMLSEDVARVLKKIGDERATDRVGEPVRGQLRLGHVHIDMARAGVSELLTPRAHLVARGAEHPLADGHDQAQLLRHWDECVGRAKAAGRVVPAAERLAAADGALGGADAGCRGVEEPLLLKLDQWSHPLGRLD